jgi:hypothetical protein
VSTKQQNYQKHFRLYKDQTGEKEVDLKKVAAWMISKGFTAPVPKTPVEILAAELSSALREETRYDKSTGRPYRANHALTIQQGNLFSVSWFDIDENPPRKRMHMSLMKRREQMVGDGLQLSLDADHWNSENPTQEPIQIPLDFELDVQIRKNTPTEKAA